MSQYDFFISYSHEDAAIVTKIVEELEKQGVKCWYAPRDVVGRYAKAIVEAISNSKIFLLCLSKHAALSEHVLNEVETAYNKKRTLGSDLIIEPLCVEPVDLDEEEFDEIMYYIRRINFIIPADLNSPQSIANEVIAKNKQYLNIVNPHINRERTKSLYFTSDRETERLTIQSNLLKKFDLESYREIFSAYEKPQILDVGSGNGEMLLGRLADLGKEFQLIGIERDSDKAAEGNSRFGNENTKFVVADVEKDFVGVVEEAMDSLGIAQFDVINISMLLLHLKTESPLLRKLRRLLKPDGVLVIRDIDDGINFAYPDDGGRFERVYQICDKNETSGERWSGRRIYTNLRRAGFQRVALQKSGFSTIGLSYEEKEAFWDMYFKFILGDIRWMKEKYPHDNRIDADLKWYEENYEDMFDVFMRDDFAFSLGFQIYTAKI